MYITVDSKSMDNICMVNVKVCVYTVLPPWILCKNEIIRSPLKKNLQRLEHMVSRNPLQKKKKTKSFIYVFSFVRVFFLVVYVASVGWCVPVPKSETFTSKVCVNKRFMGFKSSDWEMNGIPLPKKEGNFLPFWERSVTRTFLRSFFGWKTFQVK